MIARALVLLLAWIFTGYAAADPQCWTLYHGEHNWFGYPNYDDCHKLLFGDHDLSGIAAIDARSHAFVVASASGREFESESEWENRVVLPKFWSNCQDPFPCLPSYKAACNMRTKLIVGCERIAGCKIALSPTSVADMAGERRIERETGQWLPIAETGQNVNERCVGGREPGGQHTGGFDKTGNSHGFLSRTTGPNVAIKGTLEGLSSSCTNLVRR